MVHRAARDPSRFLGGSGKIVDVGEDYFTFVPNCVYGKMTYRFTRTEAAPEKTDARKSKKVRGLKDFDYREIGSHKDTNLLIAVDVRKAETLGEAYVVSVLFGDGRYSFRMTFDAIEYKEGKVLPDVWNIRYGPNAKHLMDLYYPKERGDKPLPVIVKIHGGGWGAGNKSTDSGDNPYTRAGFAYVAISYRYCSEYQEEPRPIEPPVTAPLYDAARAIQVLRSKAEELGLDKNRIGLTGGSAGACTSLWLALHDDLADPDSADPISGESTKPQAVESVQAQTCFDPTLFLEWVPKMRYGSHAFWRKKKSFEEWQAERDTILPWIKEYSPYFHASADDPPIYFHNVGRSNVPDEDPTHHPMHSLKLHEKLKECGVQSLFFAKNQSTGNRDYDRSGAKWFADVLKPGKC